MLITLDPVGEGSLVWFGSNIHGDKPTPVADFWINIKAMPSKPDQSDSVADFGEKWEVVSGPSINVNMDTNHANAPAMFTRPIAEGKSASDLMFDAIRKDNC